ncbi:MAG: ABC-type lipoprotein export system ATPase subunit [Glaciecola sp.]
MSLVHLRDVEFSYGSARFSLRVNDMRLEPGESLACMGPSGSGKTTLLELIAGLLDPVSGQVEFQGQSWSDLQVAQRQRLRLSNLGLVFQGFELLSALSVEENILLPLRFLGRPPRPSHRRAQELMESVGIQDLARQKPAQLSFGERQRAALCRALITNPSLVLADEPTANLDEESAALVLALLLSYCKSSNATLFLISHDAKQSQSMDRVLNMESLAQGARS